MRALNRSRAFMVTFVITSERQLAMNVMTVGVITKMEARDQKKLTELGY